MILTLGDSFTWGQELSNRTADAWPYLLGKQFGQEVVNLAQPGSSNDRIVRLAVEETIKQRYDLVIVAWADRSRLEVWSERDQEIKCVNVHNDFLPWIADYYAQSYNDEYFLERQSLQILLLQQHFKMINQPYLFVNVGAKHFSYRKYRDTLGYIWRQFDLSCFPGWPAQGLIEWTADAPKGPNGHPLELGHQQIADEIAKYIGNKL
jgi:hypothetical protein